MYQGVCSYLLIPGHLLPSGNGLASHERKGKVLSLGFKIILMSALYTHASYEIRQPLSVWVNSRSQEA